MFHFGGITILPARWSLGFTNKAEPEGVPPHCIFNQLRSFKIKAYLSHSGSIGETGKWLNNGVCLLRKRSKVHATCYRTLTCRLSDHIDNPLTTCAMCLLFLLSGYIILLDGMEQSHREMPHAFLMTISVMLHIKNLLICMAQAGIVNYCVNNNSVTSQSGWKSEKERDIIVEYHIQPNWRFQWKPVKAEVRRWEKP